MARLQKKYKRQPGITNSLEDRRDDRRKYAVEVTYWARGKLSIWLVIKSINGVPKIQLHLLHNLHNLTVLADTIKNILNVACIKLKEKSTLTEVLEYFLLLHLQERFVNNLILLTSQCSDVVCTWRSDLLKVAKQESQHALMWLSKETIHLIKRCNSYTWHAHNNFEGWHDGATHWILLR